jgi:hypothetical protein
MIALFWAVLWSGLAALVIAAGVTIHVKRKTAIAAVRLTVDDGVIEQILETGIVVVDEEAPLDLKDIDDEEERFWSESWDEPTEGW